MELSVPIRADGTVDYTRFASLPERRDEYTRCLTAALVPGFPAPRLTAVVRRFRLLRADCSRTICPVQPHIGYFDGWASRPDQSAGASFDYSLFATQSEHPENSAIAKFVYSGDVKGGAFDLCCSPIPRTRVCLPRDYAIGRRLSRRRSALRHGRLTPSGLNRQFHYAVLAGLMVLRIRQGSAVKSIVVFYLTHGGRDL